jgi:ubiquinone/menaquinone biosynthesis C-methylase UbiE
MSDPGSDASYFLELQTQTGWGRTLAALAEWSAAQLGCDTQPGWRSLDVGCGPGLLPALFARQGGQAVGVDLEWGMLRSGRLHPGMAQADVFHLPFLDNTFDLVTASNLLFLLPDPLGGLRQMARVTRPGGQVVTLNPSEHLSLAAAEQLANERDLQGWRAGRCSIGPGGLRRMAAGARRRYRLCSEAGLRLAGRRSRWAGVPRFARGLVRMMSTLDDADMPLICANWG